MAVETKIPVMPVPVEPSVIAQKVLVGVNATIRLNLQSQVPDLYSSDVHYKAHTPLSTINIALETKLADIDTLVAWRVAELHSFGEDSAKAVARWMQYATGRLYLTLVVQRDDGRFEDVISELAKSHVCDVCPRMKASP